MGAVKNRSEARSHLLSTGWIAPEEPVALEALTRVLHAVIANTKPPQPTMTILTSVAYILTEQMENGIIASITDKISLHINETFTTLTTDLHNRLNQQVKAATETTQSQAALTANLLKAQEKLEETTQNILKKSYSQVAAAAATTPTYTQTPTPLVLADQVRLQNREEIKRRQVLIEFDWNLDLQLKKMSETVLSEKAKDAINTVWAASPNPKPELPRVKGVVLLCNRGLLLELNTVAVADWICNEMNWVNVLRNIGSGASIKDSSYQVIVQFIPVRFDPGDDEMHRGFETVNDLLPNSVLKTEWIKPVKDRRENQ